MGGGRRKRRRKESIGRKEREKRKKKEGKKRGEAEREKITDRGEREREVSAGGGERDESRETRRYDTKRRSPCSRTRTVDENARWGRPRRNREQEQDENGGRVGEVEARARGAADREGEEAAVG